MPPTWVIVCLVALGCSILFYTYVRVQEWRRGRHNNKIIKQMRKDLLGE